MLRSLPRFATAVVALGLLGSVPAHAANRYVNPDGLCGGNLPCHVTIAAAHTAAAAGDMIIVQPATYTFTGILDVTKSVAFIGPNANINAVPTTGSTRVPGSASEAIIQAGGGVTGLFRIRSNDVEINGFELVGSTLDQIQTLSTTPVSGLRISYNIMHGAGDEGMQLRNISNSFIECNHIYEEGGDGINICCNSNNVTIRNNEIDHVNTADAAITLLATGNSLVEGNIIHQVPNGSGIQLGTNTGADAIVGGNTVKSNRVADVLMNGIAVYNSNSVIRCNEVTFARGTGAILNDFAVANNVMTENSLISNPLAVPGTSGPQAAFYFGGAVASGSMTVSNNNISGNAPAGMLNHAVPALVAQNNFWGHPTGPSGGGPGLGDLVGPNILFLPFLAAPAPTPCAPSTVCQDRPTPTVQDATWGKIKAQYR